MAPVKAMKAMKVTKAMKRRHRATKNAQGTKDKAAAPKKVNKAKKSKMAGDGMGFEVLLTVCGQCREAVEIVGCMADLQVMTLKEYYCRQGCTTCLELHAVRIK